MFSIHVLQKNVFLKFIHQVINLPYLDMVVSETLRMYPILPMIERMAMENYRIPDSNLVIEKGTPLFIPLLGLHYDSKYYSNPDVFDPERFSKENKQSLNPHVYMPFGAGPRNCIGKIFENSSKIIIKFLLP